MRAQTPQSSLFVTPWTVACQTPLSIVQSHGPQPARLLCPWDSPGKNTGLGCHAPLQGIFLPDSGIEPALQADCLLSEPPGKPQGYISQKNKTKSLKSWVCATGIFLFCNHGRLYGGKLPPKYIILGSIFNSRRTDSREFVFISQKN